MLNNDDRQFEARLKEFRPRAAEPLPMEQAGGSRRWRLVLAACTAAAVVVVAVALTMHRERNVAPAPQTIVEGAVGKGREIPRPLTIKSANKLLADAPSVKSALDGLASRHSAGQLPDGRQSALAVLGEEDF